MYVILMYDIVMNNEGSRMQRNIFKICKKYLTHVQMSVFEGEITKVQKEQLHIELKPYIRKDLDSILMFESRNEKWLNKEYWGKREDRTSTFL